MLYIVSELRKTKIAIYAVSSILLALIIIFVLSTYTSQNPIVPGVIQSTNYNFAILVNDPPVLPQGEVDALYLNFSNILIHSTSDKWISLNQSGSLNLLSVDNNSIVIYSSKIPAGEYNIIRFVGLNSNVVYYGQNYPVKVTSEYIDSYSSIAVNNRNITIVDVVIYPKLFLLPKDSGELQFLLILKSNSFVIYDYKKIFGSIPEQKLNNLLKRGNNVSIIGTELYNIIHSQVLNQKISIENVEISNEGISIEVLNVGNTNVTINYVLLYYSKSMSQLRNEINYIIFEVNNNGELYPIYSQNNVTIINATGYTLKPGEEATLNYNGEINLLQVFNIHQLKSKLSKLQILPGDKFVILLIGDYSVISTVQIIVQANE